MADQEFDDKELTDKGNTRADADIFEDDEGAPDHNEVDLREMDVEEDVQRRARKPVDESGVDEEDDDAVDGVDGGTQEAELEADDEVPEQDARGRFIDPDTKRPYGERMQRKISSEVAKRKAAEARAEAAERAISERDGKDRERAKTDADRSVVHFETRITELTTTEKTIKAALKKAHEDGDSDAIVEATDKLQKNNIAIEQARYGKTNAEGARDRIKREAEAGPARGDSQQTVKRVPRTDRWLADQQHWFGAADFSAETAASTAIEADVAREHKEGRFAHGPDSDQYWGEVNRRIKSKFPNLKIKGGGGERRETTGEQPRLRRPASPVGGSRNQPANDRRPSRDSVTLTDVDKRTMRSFNLDPNSAKDQAAYAAELRRTRASEARDREGE